MTNPTKPEPWFKNASIAELVDNVIWQAVMEGTAWCGWSDRARAALVKQVQDDVRWALKEKKVIE